MSKFWFKQHVPHVLIPFIIALLIIPGDLMARKGARLLIEKRDQQQLKGELLSVDVEEKKLVLRTGGEGVKIYMDEVESIRILRQSFSMRAVGKGFLIGAGIGAGFALITYSDPDGENILGRELYMLLLAGVFGLLGAIHGGTGGPYKKRIRIKGKFPSEIKKILKRLKKKALFKN